MALSLLSDFLDLRCSAMTSINILSLSISVFYILTCGFSTAVTTTSAAAAPTQTHPLDEFRTGPFSWAAHGVNVNCDGSLGMHIETNDCKVILGNVERLPPSITSFFESRTDSHTFPQGTRHGTCAIGLDKLEHNIAMLDLDPLGIRYLLRILVYTCVVTWGIGGTATWHGAELVLTNPAEGLTEGTCLATPTSPHQSLGQCLLGRAWQKQQSQWNGGPLTALNSYSPTLSPAQGIGREGREGTHERYRLGAVPIMSPKNLAQESRREGTHQGRWLGGAAPGTPLVQPVMAPLADQQVPGRAAPGLRAGGRMIPDLNRPPPDQ